MSHYDHPRSFDDRGRDACSYCLDALGGDASVQFDSHWVCGACARRLRAVDRQAAVPLVVAGLAAFLAEWRDVTPDEPTARLAAQRFWAQLECYGTTTRRLDVRGVLNMLLRTSPSLPLPLD
jgi:hypothetical protein